nr:HlyD family efflux transporter periplasmic adaptor subunit [Oceanococcus sp. HetDA_MAG_MS8]
MAHSSKPTRIRNTVMIGLALLLIALLAYSFRPQPVVVELATVQRAPLGIAIRDNGITRVRNVYRVSAPVAGTLLRIQASVGDTVVQGETIVARILPATPGLLDTRLQSQAAAQVRSAQAQLELAHAELRSAQAHAAHAQVDADRARKLAAKGSLAKAELETAELSARTATATLETARASVGVHQANLERAQALLHSPEIKPGADSQLTLALVAPISGRILNVLEESETTVTMGAPLIEIGDPQDLEVVVDLLSTDAVKVQPGAQVRISDWGAPGELRGTVRRIEPRGRTKVSALGIEEQRVDVIVDLSSPREQRRGLGHGFHVFAAITIWQHPDVLSVPVSALVGQPGRWAVYLADAGRVRLSPVSIGHSNEVRAQVLQGLNAGDKVVSYPSQNLRDGARIRPRPSLDAVLP